MIINTFHFVPGVPRAKVERFVNVELAIGNRYYISLKAQFVTPPPRICFL